MRLLVDGLYLLAAGAAAPWWIRRMRGKESYRSDWRGRFGHTPDLSPSSRRILLHAVSVGEVNAARQLVEHLSKSEPEADLVISATTDTGFARAQALFGERHGVVRYPLDFSFAVKRFLDSVKPAVVGLVELEVWPNFTAECQRRGIPVAVVNGRLSERSLRRYRRLKALVRPMFSRLTKAAVQTETYAAGFRELGTVPERITVTGNMKWDTAEITDDVPGAERLAEQMGIDRSRPLIVAGSTAPGEPEMLHRAVPADALFLCAPRRPQWFDEAAAAMPGCVRRSHPPASSHHDSAQESDRFVLDTIGELRQAYALADVVVIGRSFVDRGGSDMIEPVALGKATIIGPHVSAFREIAAALVTGGGLIQTDSDQLPSVLSSLLKDPARRRELAARGREIIQAHRGATQRHAEILHSLLPRAVAPSVTGDE